MTLPILAYVHRLVDGSGRVRHCTRRRGYPRVDLPGLPGSVEFMAAYLAAMGSAPAPGETADAIPGSLAALVRSYCASPEYGQLAAVTRETYRNRMNMLCCSHGKTPVAALSREQVRAIMGAKAATPAMANGLLKVLRILMRHALDDGWRRDDPTYRVKGLRSRSDGWPSWSDGDIARFEAYHHSGSRARLAMALLLYTGQRRGDVVRMGRQDAHGGRIAVRQQKTGVRLSLPVHPALQAELDSAPVGGPTFLTTVEGAPFTPDGFTAWFGDRIREAGITKGCSAHGLRKACARRLAEAGGTPHEIAAVTGHRSLREIERYTKAADQIRLSDSAIGLLGGRRRP